MTSARVNCQVPGCNHTRGQRKGEPPIRDGYEWVCGDHWQAIPKIMRKVVARTRRRAHARPTHENINSFYRIWDRAKREAIERGIGIK